MLVIAKGDVEGEEGWEVKAGKGGRKMFARLGRGKGKGTGMLGVGMGMDFVGAARRGVV